ncbi:MAG TPA: ATP-binding cassette domain-containing protein [Chloroflexota bacterium]|nr:ATP-binding cassette domain-containing protein [Chloroflexota bacterium]
MPLVARDLSFSYRDAPRSILQGLSLDLAPGRVLAVCGAARSGRSTLLSLLAGLLAPSSGSIQVDGADVRTVGVRSHVGLLLQNADEGLFGLTVREDVMFAPRQIDLDPARASTLVDNVLRAVHLDPATFAERSPFSLSGGQRRRAAMAGVLAMQPRYLLLDEPFAGLDPVGRHEIIAVVRDLATQRFGEHTGILVALSDLDHALQLADTLVILHGGRAAWQGSTGAFLAEAPDVGRWNLSEPASIGVVRQLRERGWALDVERASPAALAEAIVSYLHHCRARHA